MGQLFGRYAEDAKASKIALEAQELTVYFYTSNKRQRMQAGVDVVMTLGHLFSGLTWNQLWRKHLRDKSAQDLPDALREAKALGADMVCGAGLKR